MQINPLSLGTIKFNVLAMGLALLYQKLQQLCPFSALTFDDLKASDALVRKLPIPENTKQFVFAVRDPESQSVIYILSTQNLLERSASDADHLIRAIEPDAIVAQVGQSVVTDIQCCCYLDHLTFGASAA